MSDVNWYVVHTYSGYENKVKVNIEKTIENRKMQDQIFEVKVPLQEVVEVKKVMEDMTSVPVSVGNDANVAALGEAHFPESHGARSAALT